MFFNPVLWTIRSSFLVPSTSAPFDLHRPQLGVTFDPGGGVTDVVFVAADVRDEYSQRRLMTLISPPEPQRLAAAAPELGAHTAA